MACIDVVISWDNAANVGDICRSDDFAELKLAINGLQDDLKANPVKCACDNDCGCDFYSVAGCSCDPDNNCSCNYDNYCTCDNDCGCDFYCTCDNDCSCNSQCSCVGYVGCSFDYGCTVDGGGN